MKRNDFLKFEFKKRKFLLDIKNSSVYWLKNKGAIFSNIKNYDVLFPKWKNEFREISPQLQLSLSSTCNLHCKYCVFRERNDSKIKKYMNMKTAFRAIDIFFKTLPKHQKFARIDFGVSGEPFIMEKYFTTLKKYINKKIKSNKKIVWVGANMSNGLLYGPELIIKKINKPMDISIDGVKGDNDKFRRHKDGKGTYKDLIKLIMALKKKNIIIGACAVITADTLDIAKNFKHIFDLGFRSIYMKPVNRPHSDSYSLNRKSLPKFKKAYENFINFLIKQPDNILINYLKAINPEDFFFRFFYRIINKTILRYRCNCGKSGIYVDVDGSLYPCAHFIGARGQEIGDLSEGVSITKKNIFLSQTADNRKPCKNCWARHLCGGGCYYQAWLANKNIKNPDLVKCELIKHFIKLHSYFISVLIQKRVNILKELGAPYFSGAINSVPAQKSGKFYPRKIGTIGSEETIFNIGNNNVCMVYKNNHLVIKMSKEFLENFEIFIDKEVKKNYDWDEVCFYKDIFSYSIYSFNKENKTVATNKKYRRSNLIDIPFKNLKSVRYDRVKFFDNVIEIRIPIKRSIIGFNFIINSKEKLSLVPEIFGLLELKGKKSRINIPKENILNVDNKKNTISLSIDYNSSKLFKKSKKYVQYDSGIC